MFKTSIVTFLSLLIIASTAQALDSASVLPKGIRSPAFRYGFVSGIDEKFTSQGTLVTLTDYNAMEFNAEALQQQDPRAGQLITLLNSFQPGLGDSLNLGVLKIETKPEIKYFAPIFAYGLMKNITVAAAMPIFTYTNQIALTESGSNLAQVQAQVQGGIKEVDQAFADLRAGMAAQVQKSLAEKGYKPLKNRDEQINGDLQLVGLYNFVNTKDWLASAKLTLELPTGPKDDPDDLTDLTMFGQTAIEPGVIVNLNKTSKFQIDAKAWYHLVIPDQAVARVPVDENDSLPGANRKENLRRDLGDTIAVGTSFYYTLFSGFRAGLGYVRSEKGPDKYSGDRGWRYDLLSKNTGSSSDMIRAGFDYATTEAYLKGNALLPFMLDYEYDETIAGRNTEHRTVHELSLTMFF
jgi:hypothetical protein